MTKTQLKNEQKVFIQNDTLKFSGVVCSIEQTQDGTYVLIRTTHPIDKSTKNNYIITYISTSTLGEIILSSIRDLIKIFYLPVNYVISRKIPSSHRKGKHEGHPAKMY